jgi:biopolymer transport protein ExbB/TolQ
MTDAQLILGLTGIAFGIFALVVHNKIVRESNRQIREIDKECNRQLIHELVKIMMEEKKVNN